jgi:hypothetical protein
VSADQSPRSKKRGEESSPKQSLPSFISRMKKGFRASGRPRTDSSDKNQEMSTSAQQTEHENVVQESHSKQKRQSQSKPIPSETINALDKDQSRVDVGTPRLDSISRRLSSKAEGISETIDDYPTPLLSTAEEMDLSSDLISPLAPLEGSEMEQLRPPGVPESSNSSLPLSAKNQEYFKKMREV